jgi:hypothetical protein
VKRAPNAAQRHQRVVKVALNAKLIATYLALALSAVHDGVGFWFTFEGYSARP